MTAEQYWAHRWATVPRAPKQELPLRRRPPKIAVVKKKRAK